MKKSFRVICWVLIGAMIFMGGCSGAETQISPVRGINHRGYNPTAPENTLAAYELSREMGFGYVETDVCFTKDNVAVLLHDSSINRTARNADGSRIRSSIAISNITYEEALQYDFGIWKDEKYRGTRIPTFDAFLDLCGALGLHPYIELKQNGDYSREQITGLVETVREKGMLRGVSWISFNTEYLGWVRDADPEARLGILVAFWLYTGAFAQDISMAQALMTGRNEVFLDINYSLLGLLGKDSAQTYAALCRENGIPLEAWTIDDEETMKNLDPYVSGVTSNRLRYELIKPAEGADLVLPEGLAVIEDEAFAGMKDRTVRIPKTVTSISGNAFDPSVTLLGEEGSYAQTWAKDNGFLYQNEQ